MKAHDPWRRCDRCGSISAHSVCPCCGGQELSEFELREAGAGPVQCPRCGWADVDAETFDCLGADDGNLFCNQCNKEFTPPNEPQMIRAHACFFPALEAAIKEANDKQQLPLFKEPDPC